MQRHSDRSAFLKERGKSNLRWSGRVMDRDRNPQPTERAYASQGHHSSYQSSPSVSERLPAGSTGGASQPQQSPILGDRVGAEYGVERASETGRLVPLGEHHAGSFRVYMSHKMEKLRNQDDGAVGRREGPEGGMFKGVVAYINGYTTVPVATLRELLASRGGLVEAYNTSWCTHMICESLPYAKIRELRKMLHPPTVVRSAWVADSARAGRRLPKADYMIDGVFVQTRTLAACFAGPSSAGNPSYPSRSSSARNSNGSKDGRLVGVDGDTLDSHGAVRRTRPLPSDLGDGSNADGNLSRVIDSRRGRKRGFECVSREDGSVVVNASTVGNDSMVRHESTVGRISATDAPSRGKRGDLRSLKLPPGSEQILTPSDHVWVTTTPSPQQQPLTTGISSAGLDSGGGSVEGSPRSAQAVRAIEDGGGERSKSKSKEAPVTILRPFELPEMGAAGEERRSTKNDPTFMETFFQKSRLHYIGVGRARAVKLVNAGLAARTRPGAKKPVFGGPLGKGHARVILHVDMDCFFVSVLVRNRPELRDRPVAVAHNASNSEGAGSSEISSCNYPARAKGVKAGMFMMRAKELCPELIVLRYDFDAYSDASDKMYGVFLRYAPVVMAVSCDEAFLELGQGTDPAAAATQIRRSIFEETGCTASAGASTNMLLARMATKQAKPNGQFYLPPEMAMRHMGPLPVQDLPGVGWKLRQRLNDAGLKVCSDLWSLSLTHMQKGLGLGEKTGQTLWEACRGIDKRIVQAPPDRKSIGAEVNYGVRFDTQSQADDFLSKLAIELSSRMVTEGVVGRALTLKIMKQRDGVGQPRKYLGHGICDARSKLSNLPKATDASKVIKTHALRLLKEARVPPAKIRGIGLQMTRLDDRHEGAGGGNINGGALREWLLAKPGDSGSGSDQSAVGSAVRARLPPLVESGRSASAEMFEDKLDFRASRQKRPQRPDSDAEVTADREANHKRARESLDQSESLAMAVAKAREDPWSSKTCEAVLGVEGSDGATQKTDSSVSALGSPDSNPTIEAEAGQAEILGDGHGVDFESARGSLRGSTRRGYRGTLSSCPASPADSNPTIEVEAGQAEVLGNYRGLNSEGTPGSPPGRIRHGNGGTHSFHPGVAADNNPTIEAEAEQAEGLGGHREVDSESAHGSPRGPTHHGNSETPSSCPAGSVIELLSPSTPCSRGAGTPASVCSGNPSMSQITLSQIDSTVLDALPHDLRREVLSQLDARARLRWDTSTHDDHAREGHRTLPPAAGVRDGFDPIVREVSSKAQQVSLDSLWTLRKLRDDDLDEGAAQGEATSFVFDRDSLRAMPLALGLQHASMTETQRAWVARRYRGQSSSDTPANAAATDDPEGPPPQSTSQTRQPLAVPGVETPHPSMEPPSIPHSTERGEPVVTSLSQVDREVLECLPREVREEVLRAMASSTQGQHALTDDVPVSSHVTADGDIERDSVVDLRSSQSMSPMAPSQNNGGVRRSCSGQVFETEDVGRLRAALRGWVGGAVRSPSEWHLELLYRYLEQLVEDGRLDETATLLRCLERLATKADSKCTTNNEERSTENGANEPKSGGVSWVRGYRAVLEAVQDLVRRLKGGANLYVVC